MKIAEVLTAYPDRLWHVAKQAGVTHVVARMPLQKDGQPSVDYMDLLHMKNRYEDFGFKLEVFEPGLEWQIHKTRLGIKGRDEEIEMFKALIRNMGILQIPVLCYNFMAVFNWIRTSVSTLERGGALVQARTAAQQRLLDAAARADRVGPDPGADVHRPPLRRRVGGALGPRQSSGSPGPGGAGCARDGG